MKFIKNKKSFLLFFLVFLITPLVVSSQNQDALNEMIQLETQNMMEFMGFGEMANQRFSLVTDPVFPEPDKEVTVTAEGSAFLNSSKIEWYQNGVLISSGFGQTKFSFTNSSRATETRIKAVIHTSDEPQPIHQEVVISSGEVDLIWEAQTYTPAFYQGKSLNTRRSDLTVSAIPYMSRLNQVTDPSSLIYTWRVNGNIVERERRGKSSITLNGSSQIRPPEVMVEVFDPRTGVSARSTRTVELFVPSMLIYQHDDLKGIDYNQTLRSSYSIVGEPSISFSVVPYFFSVESKKDPNLHITWRVNGNRMNDFNNSYISSLGLPIDENGDILSGRATISVRGQHDSKSTQAGESSFRLEFNR